MKRSLNTEFALWMMLMVFQANAQSKSSMTIDDFNQRYPNARKVEFKAKEFMLYKFHTIFEGREVSAKAYYYDAGNWRRTVYYLDQDIVSTSIQQYLKINHPDDSVEQVNYFQLEGYNAYRLSFNNDEIIHIDEYGRVLAHGPIDNDIMFDKNFLADIQSRFKIKSVLNGQRTYNNNDNGEIQISVLIEDEDRATRQATIWYDLDYHYLRKRVDMYNENIPLDLMIIINELQGINRVKKCSKIFNKNYQYYYELELSHEDPKYFDAEFNLLKKNPLRKN